MKEWMQAYVQLLTEQSDNNVKRLGPQGMSVGRKSATFASSYWKAAEVNRLGPLAGRAEAPQAGARWKMSLLWVWM